MLSIKFVLWKGQGSCMSTFEIFSLIFRIVQIILTLVRILLDIAKRKKNTAK